MAYNGEFRAFFKPAKTNRGFRGAFYKLASYTQIHGMWNCKVLTLGFTKGGIHKDVLFSPIDQKKPMVFALIETSINAVYFIVVDTHVNSNEARMRNYKPFATDEFIVDCGYKEKPYWSVTSHGTTFVCGASFPETSEVTIGALCEFIGDGTIDTLFNSAFLAECKVVEEERQLKYEQHRSELLAEKEHKEYMKNWRPHWGAAGGPSEEEEPEHKSLLSKLYGFFAQA